MQEKLEKDYFYLFFLGKADFLPLSIEYKCVKKLMFFLPTSLCECHRCNLFKIRQSYFRSIIYKSLELKIAMNSRHFYNSCLSTFLPLMFEFQDIHYLL